MPDQKMTARVENNPVEMRWCPVVDEKGRIRMESRWVAPTPATSPRTSSVTHAA